jgi:hypothetical protein
MGGMTKRVKKKAAKPEASGFAVQKMRCSACGAGWLVGKLNVKAQGKSACIKCGKKSAAPCD